MSTVTTSSIDAPTMQQRERGPYPPGRPPSSLGCSSSQRPPRSSSPRPINSQVLSQPNFLADASSQTTTGPAVWAVRGRGHRRSLVSAAETPRRVAGPGPRWFRHRTCREPVLSGGSAPGDRARSRIARWHGRWVCLIESWGAIAGTAPRGHPDDLYRHWCGDLHGHTALPIEADPRWLAILGLVTYPTLLAEASWTCSTWLT